MDFGRFPMIVIKVSASDCIHALKLMHAAPHPKSLGSIARKHQNLLKDGAYPLAEMVYEMEHIVNNAKEKEKINQIIL